MSDELEAITIILVKLMLLHRRTTVVITAEEHQEIMNQHGALGIRLQAEPESITVTLVRVEQPVVKEVRDWAN